MKKLKKEIKNKFLILSQLIVLASGLCFIPGFAQERISWQAHWPGPGVRHWIGRDFWANRPEDWQIKIGRLECLQADPAMVMRSVHVITYELQEGRTPFHLSVRTGILHKGHEPNGRSWSGFLIGAGHGILDYRGAALVHHFSGKGGGLICGLDDQGKLVFRSNESDEVRDAWPEINQQVVWDGKLVPRSYWEDILLTLEASPNSEGSFDLTLNAQNFLDGTIISTATLSGFDEKKLRGNVALISHGGKTGPANRYWFRDFSLSGKKFAYFPDRAFGPVYNTLFSVNQQVMKMTVQLPPLGFADNRRITLKVRPKGKQRWWQKDTTIVIPGFTAHFRFDEWNQKEDHEYRLEYSNYGKTYQYEGLIPKDPGQKEELVIAAFTGKQIMGRPADDGWGAKGAGGAEGRWTKENVWLPQNNIVENIPKHGTDLLVFTGDQIYEGGSPTNNNHWHTGRNPDWDYLYKWYLFCWDFGPLTKNLPAIVLTDDHDVFQGDLWGNGGSRTLTGVDKHGGYLHEPEFVKMAERTQTWHNPDAYDPEPIDQGIGVYYNAFLFGGVSFCVVEDRKFKSLPTMIREVKKYRSRIVDPNFKPKEADVPGAKLLGDRQIEFLKTWVHDWQGAKMKVALMQTTFASLQTNPERQPWMDTDANGWPQTPRNRALEVLRRGHVFMIGGDTHLSAIIHHGIDDWKDAGVSFVVPAISNKYRRWWDPAEPGKNRKKNEPEYTGNHLDGFENKVTVYAVGNPLISSLEVLENNKKHGSDYDPHLLLDRSLSKDGYGIVRLHKSRQTITMECWFHDADISDADGQFPGWPQTISIDDNYGRKPIGYLPTLNIDSLQDAVVQVIDDKDKSIVYTIRAKDGKFTPKVFKKGTYSVRVFEPGTDMNKTLKKLRVFKNKHEKTIEVSF